MTSYYTFNDPSNSTIKINLDDCYNAYSSGTKDASSNLLNNSQDLSSRYNKLGTTSNLKYNITNHYTGKNGLLNDRYELKLITGGSYSATPLSTGVLLKITASTTLIFNSKLTLTQPGFVLVAGGGGGGCTNNANNAGGGGGAGEVLEISGIPTTVINNINKIDIVIGNGGIGGFAGANGTIGGNSTITLYSSSIVTYGTNGGGGGGCGKVSGGSGGSGGGGGSYSNTGTIGGASVKYSPNPSGTGKGFAGSGGQDRDTDHGAGGGGGGATAVGAINNGGLGYMTTILGTNSATNTSNNIYLGDGGGGGAAKDGNGGIGGSGTNGGTGGGLNIVPSVGAPNTGTGGGGGENANGYDYQAGANGGSGVFYLVVYNTNLIFT